MYTPNSIEKVQLPDMGSYRCAVLSESHQIVSEEGGIQLEGEFLFHCFGTGQTTDCCCQFHVLWWYRYQTNGVTSLSGLPHFSVEPQHMSVVANVSISLSCVAHGPPEPVRVIWLQDGAPLNSLSDPVAMSPSTLNLTGTACDYTLNVEEAPTWDAAVFATTLFTTTTLLLLLLLLLRMLHLIFLSLMEFMMKFNNMQWR